MLAAVMYGWSMRHVRDLYALGSRVDGLLHVDDPTAGVHDELAWLGEVVECESVSHILPPVLPSPTSYRDETNGCYVTRSSESILGGSPVVQVVGCHLLHHRSVWPAGLEH